MSLFSVAIILSCVSILCHGAPRTNQVLEDVISYSGYQVWTITPRSNEENDFLMNAIENIGLEVWKEARNPNIPMGLWIPMDVMVSPDQQERFKLKLSELNISHVVKISDLQTAIANENANIQSRSVDEKLAYKMNWTSYHRLNNINEFLTYLATTYPNLVQLIKIGTSYEGRPLNVVRISNSSNATKPAIWIDGGIHAREWISPAVVTYIIQQLVEVPANAKLLANVNWYIMPVVNPDGYEYTHTTNRFWRKTRSQNAGSTCRGADPNRNFGYKWGGKGTSTDPCSDTFKGANAFSESETRAVSNYISSKSKELKLYLTLHSYGQYLLVPWGYDVAYPSDYNDMLTLAKNAASKFRRYKFSVGNSAALLYAAAGGSDDWAKSIGIKYSYTAELADTGTYGFTLPSSYILPVCQDFFPALDVFAAQVAITP